MKEEVNAPNCGRENDLIAFLYGELSEVEARTFQHHVHDCVACNAELAAFRNVRESVVAWRNESLGSVVSTARATDSANMSMGHEKPSALAALREFFNLSPLWLKGAVAFASLLFCLFAGLAIARLGVKPPAPVANNPDMANSEKQLNALVERRVQDELQRIKNAEAKAERAPVLVKAGQNSGRGVTRSGNELATNTNQQARRPLSKTEREQLAADLRLTSAKNDTELDLLDDRINQ
jgi:anti-sigma factor RsiW